MKLLFVHGTRVYEDEEGNQYTDGAFHMGVWKRYLDLSNDFTALLRASDVEIDKEEAKKYSYVDLSKIRLVKVPDLVKPKKNFCNLKLRATYRKNIADEVKRADTIIIRMPSGVGETAVRYAKRYHKPYMIEVVGDVFTAYWFYGNLTGKIVAPIKWYTNKKIIRNAPYVNYVSSTFLQKRYPSNGKQIGCPDVILEMPKEEVLQNRLARIENMKSYKSITLGLIGALSVGYRGHETAIKTAKELINRGYFVTLKFLGGGDSRKWESISKSYGISENVEFCGALPGGKPVLQWIDKIDVLLMPTKQETLGRAVIEAMSRGCPVTGSAETAIGEQIGSDCLAQSDDYIKFSNIIEKMIVNNDYMRYCALENFYRSFKYTTEQTDKIRNQFYESFLKENKLV